MAEKRKLQTEKMENEKKTKEEKKDLDRKKIESIYHKQKEKREFSEAYNKKFTALMGSQEVTRFFQNYSNQLTLIFDFLRTNVEIDKTINFTTTHLQYKAYIYFFLYFELLGSPLDSSEIQLIYRSVSKDLKLMERIPIGLFFKKKKIISYL